MAMFITALNIHLCSGYKWEAQVTREPLSAALLVREICESHPHYHQECHSLSITRWEDHSGKPVSNTLTEGFLLKNNNKTEAKKKVSKDHSGKVYLNVFVH